MWHGYFAILTSRNWGSGKENESLKVLLFICFLKKMLVKQIAGSISKVFFTILPPSVRRR